MPLSGNDPVNPCFEAHIHFQPVNICRVQKPLHKTVFYENARLSTPVRRADISVYRDCLRQHGKLFFIVGDIGQISVEQKHHQHIHEDGQKALHLMPADLHFPDALVLPEKIHRSRPAYDHERACPHIE